MLDFSKIKMLILDCDGVLTNGNICYNDQKIETKCFSARDGMGIMLLRYANIPVAIITGRESEIVTQRAKDLKIEHVYQNIKNKAKYAEELITKMQIKWENVAYIGDDWNDYPLVKKVGISACPADAAEFYKEKVDMILKNKGGHGAVREFTDLLLNKQGRYEEVISTFIADIESR